MGKTPTQSETPAKRQHSQKQHTTPAMAVLHSNAPLGSQATLGANDGPPAGSSPIHHSVKSHTKLAAKHPISSIPLYSPNKKSANQSDAYSTLYPDTSSDSASEVAKAATKPPQQHSAGNSMTSSAQRLRLQQVCSKLPVQEPAGNMLAREPQKPGQLTPQFTLPHPILPPELRVCLQIQPMAGNLQSSAKLS